MKILGIDYGEARTGLSVCDKTELLAGSLSVIHEWNEEKLRQKLLEFIKQEKIEEIVLGYPRNMNSTEGARAIKSQSLKEFLQEQTGLNVILWDERRTTVEAHNILRENGKKTKKHKNSVDAVAASLILQGYLDYKRLNKDK